jgi:alpha-mannosidase
MLSLGGLALLLGASASRADGPVDQPKLYCVGYAHLDTQWRWSYPQVISEFLRNTLEDNFRLFDKYPHYIFNFTGANRYLLFKEYFPGDYEKLKRAIAEGHWYPAGSSMEEGDVNMPDGEAIIRQVLYGNEIFRKEFGKQSSEYMLPDCFGFQASLPSILAHCGLKGFSTQKLTWGSAVGIPFNVGVWEGPDGRGIVAALNATSYGSAISADVANSKEWTTRLSEDAAKTGVAIDYRYYGTGDRGGAPGEKSIANLEKNLEAKGGVKIISATSDQMFNDLTPAQIAMLPRYKGDLLLTNHSTGELSSEAFMKRCERKIENLADAAEHAAVIADWLGGASYPMEKINLAWYRALANQFHDTMAGTALPRAYEYAWNDEFLSLNQFAAVTQDGVGAIARAMDTSSNSGVPLVIYNPLSIDDRQDVCEATVTVPDTFKDAVSVLDASGKPVPSQVISREGNQLHLLLLANVPSVGCAVYQVVPAADGTRPGELKVSENTVENERLKVTLNADGDISSIYDKRDQRETLTAPARLAFLYQNPTQYPAWNMDYDDRSRAPSDYLSGPAKVKIVENGPVRVAIEVERQTLGSTIRQTIRLSGGSDRVEIAAGIDWQTPEHSLEAVFPLAAGNALASYESQTAAVQRGNNEPKKFTVPQQQWLDLTDSSGRFGTSILNDCKYGSDKPDDRTIRLTLLYTPGTRAGYQDQGSQDFGHHEMVYAVVPHARDWRAAGTPANARRLNQPLIAFQAPAHPGPLGKVFSFCKVGSDHVTTTAIKKAQDSDEIIVRLHETAGEQAWATRVWFSSAITSAREVDGQERELGKVEVPNGELKVDMTPFSLRAFAVKLAPPATPLSKPVCQPVQLAYDLDAVSTHEHLADGAFDAEGHAYPAESFPSTLTSEGITFNLGSSADGQKNALVCRGQRIALPGNCNKVYLLAAALGDSTGTFKIDDQAQTLTVQDWASPIGQWDDRIWQGVVPGLTYNWTNRLAGLKPGFSKRDTVAWYCTHRHDPERGNEYYMLTYLFKYTLPVPAGARQLMLPGNSNIRVFAVTAATNGNDDVQPATPLYDTLQDRANLATAPTVSPAAGTFKDTTFVTLHPPLYWKDHSLHFTTDGSEPTAASPVYTQPVLISQKTTIKAKEIDDAGESQTVSAVIDVNDVTPPAVLQVTGISIHPSLQVRFSEPVRKEQAEVAANYHLTPDVPISSAELTADGTAVTLKLAAPLAEGTNYHLTLSGIADLSPNANVVSPDPVAVNFSRPVYSLDSFVASGKGLEAKPADLPIKAGDAWTINLFVKPAGPIEDRTLIAGFGRNEDANGEGHARYLSKFASGFHFWSRRADGESRAPVTPDQWQMLSATYDGHTLVMYRNGKPVAHQDLKLADDEPVVEIAPLDPWEHVRRFSGEIRGMTIWNAALPAEVLKELQEPMPK